MGEGKNTGRSPREVLCSWKSTKNTGGSPWGGYGKFIGISLTIPGRKSLRVGLMENFPSLKRTKYILLNFFQWQHFFISMLQCRQLTQRFPVSRSPWQQRRIQQQTLKHLLQQILAQILAQTFQISLTLWRKIFFPLIQPRWWWSEEVLSSYLLSLSKTMGTFVDNIPIVWVVKKNIDSDSGSYSMSVGQPIPDNPIILIPKQGSMREIPQVMRNPFVSMVEPGIIDQIKGIDHNALIYLVGGSILLIILLR